ncbi:MAG TPA: hypothetical protein VHK90_08395 [Thermoanaerobaculia bacterium]|nr:hypothetical protein [Thermoanaerobaculia bacterium]
MELIARSPEMLRPLRTRRGRRDVSRVVLLFPHEERDQRAIDRGLRACGCEVGSLFLAVTLAALAIALAAGWRTSWWNGIAIVFGAALAGKITGLLLAEWRLRAAIRRLAG